MKKIFTAALAMALLISVTACGQNTTAGTSGMDNYKLGLAGYTHTDDSYGYTEGKNGRGAVSTTYVAAVFDGSGKIVKIAIDEVESNINFDATGQLADYAGGQVLSKKELGDNYGMRAASDIGKEWHEQISTMEKWLVGKDVKTIISSANSTNSGANSGTGTASTATSGNNTSSGNASGSSTMTDGAVSSGAMGDIASGANSVMDGVMSGANNMMDGMVDGVGSITGTMNDWMDEDLKAGVTIDTTYIVRAIEKAYKNAK